MAEAYTPALFIIDVYGKDESSMESRSFTSVVSLVAFLRQCAEHAYLNGRTINISALWAYTAGGKLRRVTIEDHGSVTSRDDTGNQWIHTTYELLIIDDVPVPSLGKELLQIVWRYAFTVTLKSTSTRGRLVKRRGPIALRVPARS